MNKYHNHKFNGFDSKAEAKRFLVLQSMESDGLITDLQRQVKFELIPSQRINGKVVERAVSYIADFTYRTSDGLFVVEDVKGFRPKEYIIKRKLMLWVHGIKVREIK